MKDHSECKRQFSWLSKAWYGKANLTDPDILDEIHIGFYHKGGGSLGEFSIRWHRLGPEWAPRLEVFDDAWDALYRFKDLLEKLTELDDKTPTPEEIAKVLIECGIEDATETEKI